MKSKYLQYLLLLIGSLSGYAQQPYYNQRPEFLKANHIWAFGTNSGLDFTSGGSVPFPTSITGNEGHAAVSDPLTGKLLFYSNGKDCWNANGQVMPNGDSLLGNGSGLNVLGKPEGLSTAQGVCIVPVIDTPNKYYLFSLFGSTNSSGWDANANQYDQGVLFYSVVDMDLDSGWGDIEPGRKNIVLDRDTLGEGMIAIPGNNCDIWLMVHAFSKPEFKAYHITHNGIDTQPVISITGSMHGASALFGGAYLMGEMAISPDRTKIVISNGNNSDDPNTRGTLIGHFDPVLGRVSGAIQIVPTKPEAFGDGGKGPCFSPDNSKLYIMRSFFYEGDAGDNGGNGGSDTSIYVLCQYDVSIMDSARIVNSMLRIKGYNIRPGTGKGPGYTLRLYNDTIYADARGDLSLHRINNPNNTGVTCNFQLAAVPISGRCLNGIGNSVVYPIPFDTIYQNILHATVCPQQEIILEPKLPAYSGYIWSDGSTSQTLNIKEPGVYWVKYNENMCQYRIDTFVIEREHLDPVININVRELSTTRTYNTYQWLVNGNEIPGATQRTYTITQNGDYQVIVTSEQGCIDTSEIYTVTNYEETDITGVGISKESIQIFPNPVRDIIYVHAPDSIQVKLIGLDGKVLLQDTGSSQINLDGVAKGAYFLQIYDQYGRLLTTEKIIKAW